MKIDKIYMLSYISSDEHVEGNFYTTKEEALENIEEMKDKIEEIYANDGMYPIDSKIWLKEIDIEEMGDNIGDYYSNIKIISEWVPDFEEDETIYYMWRDKDDIK